jgi:multicomponent Na+:H+ antiporter subunit B
MISHFYDVIVQTVCRLLIPFIQVYGLYVIAHGHSSPGGGFQGGVILGASFILLCLSHDIQEMKRRLSQKAILFYCSLGVFIYAGIGLICLLLGGKFLDYGRLHEILPVDPVGARSLGIFGIEVGVGITVMAVMVSIFLELASEEKEKKELEQHGIHHRKI